MPFVKVNGIKIFYEDEGEGETLLMIQGLGYDSRPFLWLREALKQHFRTIIFDNRGAGRSDKPPGPYNIEQMAHDAAGLLEKLGIEKASVFGVSLGGYIAQMLGLRHPEKLKKLIIGCSFFTGDPGRMDMRAETVEILTKREGTPEEIARRGLGVAFSENFPPRRPDIFEQLVRWRVEDPIPPHSYLAQLQAGMGFDVEKEVSRITGDVLIIHGELDRVVPADRGRELGAAIKGSKLVLMKEAGHLFFIEEVEKSADLISRFIRGEDRAALPRAPAPGNQIGWHPHDFLAARAAVMPEKIALIDEKTREKISFGELNRRAERAAWFLSGLGIRKGHRVGVLSLNGSAMVELLFACGKIGALFVPFNYRLSAQELKGIVKDASPSIFCCDGTHAGMLKKIKDVLPPETRIVALDKRAARSKKFIKYSDVLRSTGSEGEAPALPVVTLEDPWIICYTGGTTGTPKGALLTHGSVFWNAVNTITGWCLRDNDIAPIFTPLFHTGGLNVLLTPLLLLGGTSILVPAFDADRAFRIIKKHKATYLFMVPSMYKMMIQSSRWEKEKLRTIRDAVTGGAPCPRDIYEAFSAKGKRFRMGYGLTEAGPNNFHMDPEKALEYFGSVGKPMTFVQAKLDLEEGKVGKPGEVGELLLRGGHLFAGYWNKPAETAAVLRSGWLRTGDLAKCDGEGNFTIVGRKKEMFISGGENVFPSEVEEVILRHEEVEDTAVVGIADEKWGEVGLAAVVLKKGSTLSAEALKRFCRERVAHYKVPKKFVFLDELPKTGAGKINKPLIAKTYK